MKNLMLLSFCFLVFTLKAQTKLHPVIKSSGEVFDVPYAEEKPDPTLDYKIIASIGGEIEKPNELHPSLGHFARLYNLHVYGGVPQNKLNVVLVIYFKATPIVLNNEAYRAKYKVDNPNLELIEELKKAGVKVLVCSQSLEILGIDHKNVASIVIPAVSRFTALSTYQLRGYALFSL